MGRNKTSPPVRTCISCGAKRSKSELIRLVLDDQGQVIRDDLVMSKGRGAYVCPRKICWENLRRGRRLNRAFKKEGTITVSAYFEENGDSFLK